MTDLQLRQPTVIPKVVTESLRQLARHGLAARKVVAEIYEALEVAADSDA